MTSAEPVEICFLTQRQSLCVPQCKGRPGAQLLKPRWGGRIGGLIVKVNAILSQTLLIPSVQDTAKHLFILVLKEGRIYTVSSNTVCQTEALNHWFLSGQIHFSPQTVSPPPQCLSRQQRPLAESGLVGKWECGD